MSAISAVWLYVGWGAVLFETNYGLMQHSPSEIKEKLLKALDKEYNVVDMAAVVEIVSILERTPITKEALETTRLGRYINELRRKTTNELLAKRAKELVRRWRHLILPSQQQHQQSVSGSESAPHSPAAQPQQIQVHQQQQNGSQERRRTTTPLIVSPLSPAPGAVTGSGMGTPLSKDCLVVDAVPRTHASNKRLRKDAISPTAERLHPTKSAKLNGASFRPDPETVGECSRDGSSDGCEILSVVPTGIPTAPPIPTTPVQTISSSITISEPVRRRDNVRRPGRKSSKNRFNSDGNSGAGSKTNDDLLKEKIASVARNPRVKTTRELVADLRSRSSEDGIVSVSETVPTDRVISTVGDQELTRSKTEHIAKFLRSQPETCAVVQPRKNVCEEELRPSVGEPLPAPSLECAASESEDAPDYAIREILDQLPPLDPDLIIWDRSTPSPPPDSVCIPVTDCDVDRLHRERVENLNGNFDHASAITGDNDNVFREWHEMVSRTSYNGELLHILPYVVID